MCSLRVPLPADSSETGRECACARDAVAARRLPVEFEHANCSLVACPCPVEFCLRSSLASLLAKRSLPRKTDQNKMLTSLGH